MQRLGGIVLALLFCVGLTPTEAQIRKGRDGGYLFRVRYVKGQKARYQVTMVSQGIGGGNLVQTRLESPFQTQVMSVQKGIATLRCVMGPIKFNGKPAQQARTFTLKQNDRGQTVGTSDAALKEVGGALSQNALPEKSLKMGEVYTRKQTVTNQGQDLTIYTRYRFVGIQKAKRGRSAFARMNVSIQGDGTAKVRGSGVILFAVATGALADSNLKQSVTLDQGGQSVTVRQNVRVVRK